MRPTILPAWGLATLLVVAGCDSQGKLTATVPTSGSQPTLAASQSINATASVPTVTYTFAASALPADLQGATSLTVAVQGRPVPVASAGPGTLAISLPVTAPQADLNGNLTVLIARESGVADLVTLHVTH